MRARALLATGLLAASVACTRGESLARLSAEEQTLLRRIKGLEATLASAKRNGGHIVPFDQILVVVRQRLIQGVLDSALPLEQVVAQKYLIRATAAHVLLEDGFAIVELEGRASLVEQPDVLAEVKVYAALDVVDLDSESGSLRARVKVFAVEARSTQALGVSVPVEQLVEDLSRQQVEAFAPLLSAIDIPVKVGDDITLPAMGPEGGVTIGEARIPLGAVVEDVKSFRHRLWISIRATRTGKAQ